MTVETVALTVIVETVALTVIVETVALTVIVETVALTVIVETVTLVQVDDGEFVGDATDGILDTEVVPLCVTLCVQVCPQDQVVLKLSSVNTSQCNT